MIKALIIDDEIEACEGLAHLLEKEEGIEVIGICRDGLQAEKEIKKLTPDLVFLDIQMPYKNGFEVLEAIPQHQLPMVVFVTAYDEYALEAFRIHALDYLQKPFSDQRFSECLEHVKSQFGKGAELQARLKQLTLNLRDEQKPKIEPERLIIKSSGKILFLRYDEVQWVEGFDYYIKIHTEGSFHLVRKSLSKILNELPNSFIRVHNSSIVNINNVKLLEPLSRGNCLVHIQNGHQVIMSKKYREEHSNLFPK